MFSKKNKVLSPKVVEQSSFSRKNVPSIIVSDLNIQGDLVSEGAIEIGGKVNGNVMCDHVTIRKGSEINGNIKAENLTIHGFVNGEINTDYLFITNSGHITGKIEYSYLNVESGANIDGYLKRKEPENIKIESEEAEIEFIPQIETIIAANKEEENISAITENKKEQGENQEADNSDQDQEKIIDNITSLPSKKKKKKRRA